MQDAGRLKCRCSPQRKAEKGATVVALQGAPEVQERSKGIGELAEQVRVLEANLEARLGRGDAGQVAAVRVEHDHVVARHKHGHIGQIVDRIEAQAKSLHWHTDRVNSVFFFLPNKSWCWHDMKLFDVFHVLSLCQMMTPDSLRTKV